MRILIISLLFMTACASEKEVLDTWLGHGKKDLIMQWGPPDLTTSDGDGGEIIAYVNQVYMPNYNVNYYNYRMFYVNREGKIYHWLTKKERINPQQIDLNIYRRN
jgi:hypothetical protein